MELIGAHWRISTRSSNGGSTCVEVATNLADVVGVRDSTDRGGPVLAFGPAAWTGFLAAARSGDLSARQGR